MSKIYGKAQWRRQFAASLRAHTRYWILIGVGLLLMAAAAGTAAAAIVLSGRGTVVAPAPGEQQLLVSDEQLSEPLTPGGAADLLFTVRNPNAFAVVVNRVSVAGLLRKAKPAGCTAKVSGPVTRRGGYALPGAEQVTVPARSRAQVVVLGAFTLADNARGGCGFTVDILVNATQAVPVPTVAATTTAPQPTIVPTTTVPTTTTAPADPPPATGPVPPVPNEDPADIPLPPGL